MRIKQLPVNKLITFAVILITIVFLLPVFIGGISGNGVSSLLTDSSNGFIPSLERAILFTLLSSISTVIFGFCLALLLSNIPSESKLGRQLSFFILPITFGNISIVFILKILLFNTALLDTIIIKGSPAQTLFLLVVQLWQFGFLFAYLFWLNIQATPRRLRDYAIAAGLTRFEKIRDIILPQSRNLFILLVIISFTFSFYEDAKSQFIFRASQGTETELVNHWLDRVYHSDLLINPKYAGQQAFATGMSIFVIALLLFLLLGLLIIVAVKLFSKLKARAGAPAPATHKKTSLTIAAASIAIIIAPVILALLKSQYHFSDNIYSLLFPFILTLIGAIAATLFAITYGIFSKLSFQHLLNGFNAKSLLYFLILFILQIIPPLCIVLCGFTWLSWVGYSSDTLIYIVWVIGHCILRLPLLGSFVLVAHFSVKANELNYQMAHGISRGNIIKYSFLKRFRAEYILTLLFAFSFIWNDSGLNATLSDQIPSFSSNLQMLFIGRAADYSKATGFAIVALLLSLSCIFGWQYIIRKKDYLKA
ncbi:MAG: sugar ABC transporter permease [Bacteroidetes bacterium]|nr:sugar ABC transporter permease [Bacteroidota bacterium]